MNTTDMFKASTVRVRDETGYYDGNRNMNLMIL